LGVDGRQEDRHCTFYGECQEACPKLISIDTIVRMNRDYLRATLTAAPEHSAADGGG
jgi:succinate dehydrogenase/fumarate reductase-like Fe-S protein